MNKTLPALPGKAPALPPGAFEIGYTAHDGAQHRVPLAEAAVVRFADTQPTRRIRAARGSGTCQGAGGRLPMAATSAMNRGWSATS
jgi:hypothetical protein